MAKTVLITGASSGFGKETAKVFSAQGWNVIATMRSPEQETALGTLKNVMVTGLDVEDIASIEAAVAAGLERFGSIDALVNNAGYGLMGVFEASDPVQVRKQYAVNVFGLMDVTRTVLPYMRKQGGGAIINVSSFGGIVALPFGSPYVSSKFAVEGFSEALSHELEALNIAVKIIEPGSVATNFSVSRQMTNNEIEEYNPLIATFFQRFMKKSEQFTKADAKDVAATIYQAVTDGTKQLRYVVGPDAQYYIDLKLNNSEADFVNYIRDAFIRS